MCGQFVLFLYLLPPSGTVKSVEKKKKKENMGTDLVSAEHLERRSAAQLGFELQINSIHFLWPDLNTACKEFHLMFL